VVTPLGKEVLVLLERIVLAVEEVLHIPPDNPLRPRFKTEKKQDGKDYGGFHFHCTEKARNRCYSSAPGTIIFFPLTM